MSFVDELDPDLLAQFVEKVKRSAELYDEDLFQWFFMNKYQDFLEEFKEEVESADDTENNEAPGLDDPDPYFPYWLEKVEKELEKVDRL